MNIICKGTEMGTKVLLVGGGDRDRGCSVERVRLERVRLDGSHGIRVQGGGQFEQSMTQ